MKIISIILSISMLYLWGNFCEDVRVADENTKEVSYSQHDHENNPSDSDACSSFCVCDCCHTPVVIPNDHSLKTPVVVSQARERLSYYWSLYPNDINYSIWRPPSLV